MTQPNMAKAQEALGPWQEKFMIACNRPENDDNWASDDPEWLGKASMSKIKVPDSERPALGIFQHLDFWSH